MVELKITGCTALNFPRVREVIGARHPRGIAGLADRDSYIVEYVERGEAETAVTALNALDGIRAELLG